MSRILILKEKRDNPCRLDKELLKGRIIRRQLIPISCTLVIIIILKLIIVIIPINHRFLLNLLPLESSYSFTIPFTPVLNVLFDGKDQAADGRALCRLVSSGKAHEYNGEEIIDCVELASH